MRAPRQVFGRENGVDLLADHLVRRESENPGGASQPVEDHPVGREQDKRHILRLLGEQP
jgi:hypothetical protein